jgi:tRNA threonylcarbamoyladenosine biosynthesis protein TsaB
MNLIINTAENNKISLSFLDGDILLDQISIESRLTQAERLLPLLDEVLRKNNKKLTDVEGVGVVNQGEGFTSLRIGVVTANGLAYALGVPLFSVNNVGEIDYGDFKVVKPIYSREPNIN